MSNQIENNLKKLNSYVFGLDIGIASVGWAVLAENRIVATGVRAFNKAETAKEGESLNLARRQARLTRRRIQRKAVRLKRLVRILKKYELTDNGQLFKKNIIVTDNVWQLRVDALNRLLTPLEWARVIYHISKHRGFHWVSKAEERKATGDEKSEGGRVKQGLNATKALMQEKNYRTTAEMLMQEFPSAQRNKNGEYTKAISRVLLAEELAQLFISQRAMGNVLASPELEFEILGSGDKKTGNLWEQKPSLSGEQLLKMLGKCTFEKNEFRAPKASFTAERHVWLTKLNNTRVYENGVVRPLTEKEHTVALQLPYLQASDLTYKQIRAAWQKSGLEVDNIQFAHLNYGYKNSQTADKKPSDPESERIVKLAAWQELKKGFNDAGLKLEWEKMAGDALCGKPQLLDQIAWILSVYKEESEVLQELKKLEIPGGQAGIDILLGMSFDKFHALSLKALYQIVPLMEQGKRYDEAVALIPAYLHHSQIQHDIDHHKTKYLPSFYEGRDKNGALRFAEDLNVPRNPVVLRALNQARKVVNALIKEYGSPLSVHIELARDLSKPFDERQQISRDQKAFGEKNQNDKNQFEEMFGRQPSGQEFEKYRLYREQNGKCIYSLQAINLDRLLEPGYVEIDHALPYSRSFDDSKNNKVLALTHENRNKGNRTPYEYLDGASNSQQWIYFSEFVNSNKAYRLAKQSRLLRKNFGTTEANEFKDRNLNDTRYICKFFKNFVETHLALADTSSAKRCVVVSGQLTSFLRARWGLIKNRAQSDRHHALDAIVVAACTHSMVQRLSNYAKNKELQQVKTGFVDVETGEIIDPVQFAKLNAHFPEPWPGFRNEVMLRVFEDNATVLHQTIKAFATYSELELQNLKPLFVSRAPQRRNSGAAHKDTIYGQRESLKPTGEVTQKVALANLTLKMLDDLIEPHRNERLYEAIKVRLMQAGGKADKAFSKDKPLYKPSNKEGVQGPIVRSVTIKKKESGLPIRGGLAKNDTMLRVDVFTKLEKFYLIPVYVNHKAMGLPNKAIVQGKDESDWTLIDESFTFKFSLYPNDYINIVVKGKQETMGYFAGCDRSTGGLNLWAQDRSDKIGKDGLIRGIGVKVASEINKFEVDVLGNIYPSRPEVRHGLA